MNNFEDFEKDVAELKYCYEFVQQVRTLLFWAVDPDESRDKLAMVILAKYTLLWIKERADLKEDVEQLLTDLANKIIEAGTKSDTPMVLEPMRIGVKT